MITIGGKRIHYWESNPDKHPVLLMLHGFRSSHQGLMKLAARFPDFHLVIPDFPGYGMTDEIVGQQDLAVYPRFIESFINTIRIKDFAIIGHSFGAVVGLMYAASNPTRVNQLILVSPVPKANLISRAGAFYYLVGRALPAPLDKKWLTIRTLQRPVRALVIQTHDPIVYADVMAEGELELEALNPKVNIENYLSLAAFEPVSWVTRISIPILVIAGDADRLTPLADIKSSYQSDHTTLKVISGMGHFAPAEIPVEIATVVHEWLTEIKNPAAAL